MANTIKLKRGLKAKLSTVTLAQGEPAFTTDDGKLYINDGEKNVPINPDTYGICSTAAATAAKEVTITGFTKKAGTLVVVKFTIANTAASPSLNVNASGAAPIYYRGAAITASYLAANYTYAFLFNGTQYDMVGDVDTNTTYTHSSGDGNLHVPATGTTNSKKVLKAGATAGSVSWGNVDFSELTGTPTTLSGYSITDAMKADATIDGGTF